MKRKIGISLIGLFFVVFTASIVLAQMGVPHQFYGTVTYNGASAPNGVSVVAKIDGITVKGTTTLDGKYGYDPLFLITDPDEGRAGKTIIFYVNDIESSSFIFSNGRVTELNLIASGPPLGGGSDEDSGDDSSGGGSSSSSSSSSSTGEAVNTGSDTNSESSDENQINVGGGITGATIGSSGGVNFLPLLILLVLVLAGIVLFFGIKKQKRER